MKYYRDQKLLNKISQRIKELRKAQNKTQQQLADDTDFEVRQIKRIENAEVNCSVSHIAAIAKAFKLTVAEFFDFESPKYSK